MKPNPFNDLGLLIMRLGVGLIVLYYGCQKLFGLFGGYGFSPTLTFFHEKMGIPIVFVTLCILAESLGSVALILGLLSRLASLGLTVNFAVATYFATNKFALAGPIFSGHAKPTDLPLLFFPALLCLASLGLTFTGPGQYAIDARLFRPRKRKAV